MTWNVLPFQQFLHKKINSLFLPQDPTSKVFFFTPIYLASENCWFWIFLQFSAEEKKKKKILKKKTGISRNFSVQCINTFIHSLMATVHPNTFHIKQNIFPKISCFKQKKTQWKVHIIYHMRKPLSQKTILKCVQGYNS